MEELVQARGGRDGAGVWVWRKDAQKQEGQGLGDASGEVAHLRRVLDDNCRCTFIFQPCSELVPFSTVTIK